MPQNLSSGQPPSMHPLPAAVMAEVSRRQAGHPPDTMSVSTALTRHGAEFLRNPPTEQAQQAWLHATQWSLQHECPDILRLLLSAAPPIPSAVGTEMVKILLQSGVDPVTEPSDTPSRPPLFLAALSGNHVVMELLLAAGADPNTIRCPQEKDYESMCLTALAAAVMFSGSKDSAPVRLLLEAGADPRLPAFVETIQVAGGFSEGKPIQLVDSTITAFSPFRDMIMAAASRLDAQEQQASLDATTPFHVFDRRPRARL